MADTPTSTDSASIGAIDAAVDRGITSLNYVLIPKLKELFTLKHTQAMLVQFCFFTAYLVVRALSGQMHRLVSRWA